MLWRAGIVSRRLAGRVTVYSLADPEAFVLIEGTANAIARQLRDLGADA